MLRAGRRVLAVLGVLGVLAARHPMKSHAGGPPTASGISLPQIPLALGGEMWHTVSVLPLKGEITDYLRSFKVPRDLRCVWGGAKTGKMMSDLKRNMINYMVVCVNDYADRHGLSYAETFDYLLRNKGLDFLEDCYDAEHTLSLDTALDDLDAICKRNEGLVA